MSIQTCLIIGAGPEVYWDNRFTPDCILCADGGLDHARTLGLRPDVYIGDRDSVHRQPEPAMTVFDHPAEKDYTDLQACVEYAIERKFSEVAIIGATGGRLDHFFANVGFLEPLWAHGIRGMILNARNEIRLLEPSCTFDPPHAYRYFSILPLDERVTGVCIEGARYPLTDAVIRRGDTLGVSNEPLPGQAVRITLGAGRALLIRSDKL